MRYLQRRGMWLQVIVDPAGKNSGFHRRSPRLWQCFHPTIQVKARCGQGTFRVNVAAAILHAVADRPLVNIQPNVIHTLHGGASLVSLNQRPLSSAFCTPSAPPSTYAFKLTRHLDKGVAQA